MEYTDAPSTQTADTMLCPNCGQRLPKGSESCDQCGWKHEGSETAEGTASDAMAALLSIVPGLGHVYKGYRGIGLLFAIGTLIVLGFAGLAAIASAGFGLGMAVFYWTGVAMHAYAIKDRVVPSEKDEGEQY
jgi:hypothetical protein